MTLTEYVEAVKKLEFEWETEYLVTPLCLKQSMSGKKATVVQDSRRDLSDCPRLHRIYDGYVNGKLIHKAGDEFKLGQVIKL